MTNEKRLEIELRIVNRYMVAMEQAGYVIASVDYGDGAEEDQGRRSLSGRFHNRGKHG